MAGVYQIYPKKKRTSFFKGFSLTLNIIIINVLVFIGVIISSLVFGERVWDFVALKPSNVLSGKYLWTFLTSMFMHGGFFHLFVNMFVLFSLGGMMEKINKLKIE